MTSEIPDSEILRVDNRVYLKDRGNLKALHASTALEHGYELFSLRKFRMRQEDGGITDTTLGEFVSCSGDISLEIIEETIQKIFR